MLDLLGYTSDKDLSKWSILEPSFGEGEFLLEIQRRVIQSATIHGFDATEIMIRNVYGCEIDKSKYNKCAEALKILMPDYTPKILRNEDFLLSVWDTKFDFIVGNPPYIRYENIPIEMREAYKVRFSTFYYRCDLYVLFYDHCLNYLSENGHHCFICSNRWLKNEYGKKLRALIALHYHLDYVINVENLDVFQKHVLAYPSITVISNTPTDNKTNVSYISRLDDLKLPIKTKLKPIKDIVNWNSLFLDDDMENLFSIEEQGFIIGIGVATGADSIFISSCFKNLIEDELLLPIINARDLTRNELKWRGLFLLNPYNSDGSLIDLKKYPKAKKYLDEVKSKLVNRHIVKNGRCWYSLIDKVRPELKNQVKILLPDISGNRVVLIDEGSYYPAHNIYYITGKPLEELKLLAAILMSDMVKTQIESISNKMNGGFPRWQSQNIKKIRIPKIAEIPYDIRSRLIDAYDNSCFAEINKIIQEIINSHSGTSKYGRMKSFPKSLFDYNFSVSSEASR